MNITIPKNGSLTIDGVTYYATDAATIDVSTESPKTEQELAREWWNGLALRGDDRWRVEPTGNVTSISRDAATMAANSWPPTRGRPKPLPNVVPNR